MDDSLYDIVFDDEHRQPRPPSQHGPIVNQWDSAADFITETKVMHALSLFGPKKAAGPDKIIPLILQKLGPASITRLTNIYRACVLLGKTPAAWHEAALIFLAKPGKSDMTAAKSWRPISLVSFLLKGLERIWLWFLEGTTFKDKPLHDSQHGFRQNRSCDSCLTSLCSRLECVMNKNHYVIGASLDMTSAYDLLSYEKIEEILNKRQVDPIFTNWYMDFLRNRTISIENKGVKLRRKAFRGVMQGSIISPAIFGTVVNELLELFDEDEGDGPVDPEDVIYGKTYIAAYADDTTFYVAGTDLTKIQSKLQASLDAACLWASGAGLKFSPEKSKVVIFTRKKKFDKPPKLILNGNPIKYSGSFKLLGCFLDSKLSFKMHLKEKIKAGKRALGKMVRVCSQGGWGLKPWAVNYYYKAIIRPALTFGSIIWAQVVRHKWAQDALRSYQRLALKHMGPCRRSTPTLALEMFTYTRPLELELRKTAAEAFLRTMDHQVIHPYAMWTNKVTHKGHRQHSMEFLETIEFKYGNCDTDRLPKRLVWGRGYTIDTKSMDPKNKERGKYQHGAHNGDLQIFTDGSLDPKDGSTGSGVNIGLGLLGLKYNIGQKSVFFGRSIRNQKSMPMDAPQYRRN